MQNFLPESIDYADLPLLTELQKRRTCRTSLLGWCSEALLPIGQTPAAHHRLLIEELEKVTRGETQRLMINMPPGSAKSTYGSVLFPAWAFAQRDGFDIIGASNTARMAEGFSRKAIGFAAEHKNTLGYGLTRDTAEEWTTTNRGLDEVDAWQNRRNKNLAKADWQFTTADTRVKLKRLYPTL